MADDEELQVQVLAAGDEDDLLRPCVDCGLITGNFCETPLQRGHDEWQGGVCLAESRVPSEKWVKDQRTPLCYKCESNLGACRFCRGYPH